ncbi:MAG: DUF6612 family protein [Syntrophomonadaceae bacterium]|jgi:hypothetical protein
MRKVIIGLCTLLALLIFSMPVAAADVTLDINGHAYAPATAPQIQEGTTMVPLYLIEKISGADVHIADQSITIHKNDKTMALTLGSTEATLNDEAMTLPQAPFKLGEEIMVPIRAIMEALGATIGWNGETYTVLVNFQEKRDGMTPEELLLKSNEAILAFNTYKVKGNLDQYMQIVNPETKETEKMEMGMVMEMAMQNDPLLLYAQTSASTNLPDLDPTLAEAMDMEMVFNEEGLYTTMPGQGWVRMSLEGMDIKALLEEASQDPLKSLQDFTDAGVLFCFGNDKEENGKSYWVINVTMGPESFQKYLGQLMEQIPLVPGEPLAGEEMAQILEQVLGNMKADLFYSMWVDKDTLLPQYMDFKMNVNINIEVPGANPGEEQVIDMVMQQSGTYDYYGFDEPIEVPDLSNAIDIEDLGNLDIKTEQAPEPQPSPADEVEQVIWS